jgi:hypothetical protein
MEYDKRKRRIIHWLRAGKRDMQVKVSINKTTMAYLKNIMKEGNMTLSSAINEILIQYMEQDLDNWEFDNEDETE